MKPEINSTKQGCWQQEDRWLAAPGQAPAAHLPMACLPVSADLLLTLNDPLHDLLVLLCILCGTGYLSTGILRRFSLLGVSFGGCTSFTTVRSRHMRSIWPSLLFPKPSNTIRGPVTHCEGSGFFEGQLSGVCFIFIFLGGLF